MILTNGGQKLDFGALQPLTATFLEIFFVTLLLAVGVEVNESQRYKLHDTFTKLKEMDTLRQGIEHFINMIVRRSDILEKDSDRRLLNSACKRTLDTLRKLSVDSV